MKILIEIWMDGYNSKEDMRKAIVEGVEGNGSLDCADIKLLWAEDSKDFDW